VGREETLGMLAAVEAWVKRDHDAEWKKWLSYLDTIARSVSRVEGVQIRVREPEGLSNKSPVLLITWDPGKLHITGEEVAEDCARHKPRIALGAGVGGPRPRGAEAPDPDSLTGISITAWMMLPGDDRVVADRLHEILSRKRSPKPAPAAPAADLSGRWDVTMEFFSSSSRHTLTLEQKGNRLEGTHQGDFSVRDVYGTIEGDRLRLQSTQVQPGDVIPYTFVGSVSGDSMSGPIHMGEYLMARFTARRHTNPARRGTINVPGGPPLAN
jgi:D-glucosaminate-6-phosphate ammonia-lyase